MPEVGQGVIVPDTANVPGAWQEVIALPVPAAGAIVTYKTKSGYYDVPQVVFVQLTTSAAVTNRNVWLAMQDQDGGFIWTAPATAAIAANDSQIYNFFAGKSLAYGPVNGFNVASFPDLAMLPGYVLTVQCTNMQAADAFLRPFLTVVHVPTGGVQQVEVIAEPPTPLVLT